MDAAAMAKERIANANATVNNQQGKTQQVFLLSRQLTQEEKAKRKAVPNLTDTYYLSEGPKSEKTNEEKEENIFMTSLYDTQTVLNDRVRQYEAIIRRDKIAWDQGEGRNQSNTEKGSMLDHGENDRYKVPAEELRPLHELYALQKELNAFSLRGRTMVDLQKIRVQLGIPELPQSLVPDTNIFNELALKAAFDKDPSLSINWDKLRAEFQQTELMLNRAETVLQIVDTGVGIAAGLVPYGSEVYQLSRSLTHVAQGTMTPEDAARDFIVGVLASHVGGKVAEKLHVEQFVGTWVKKNATYFSKETAQVLASIMAGATRGSATGMTDGTMSGTYNVLRGKQTVKQAVDETVKQALIGMLFGGVTAGGMEAWQIRGEKLNEAHMRQLKETIMSLPDGERPKAAEAILGRELTGTQKEAVIAAHKVPMKDGRKYSPNELKEKMRILEASEISRDDANKLLRMGVTGSIPESELPARNSSADTAKKDEGLEAQKQSNASEDAPKKMRNTIDKLIDIPDGKFTISRSANKITVKLTTPDNRVSGLVVCERMPNSSLMIVESSNATKGYGPLIYDVAMEAATQNGCSLVSDRSRVSDDAYKVWQFYYFNRPDIQKVPLDMGEWYDGKQAGDILNKVTDDPTTWPNKSDPIWSLWTGYRKKPEIFNTLKQDGKLIE